MKPEKYIMIIENLIYAMKYTKYDRAYTVGNRNTFRMGQ